MIHNRTNNGFEAGLFGPGSPHNTLATIAAKYPESSIEHEHLMLAIKSLFFITVNGYDTAFYKHVQKWEREPLTKEQYERLYSQRLRSLDAYERRLRSGGQKPPQ